MLNHAPAGREASISIADVCALTVFKYVLSVEDVCFPNTGPERTGGRGAGGRVGSGFPKPITG